MEKKTFNSPINSFEGLIERSPIIEERLGYTFKHKKLLALAFVHRSFFNEHRDQLDEHNERLEFLGDSILGLLISDYLYEYLPSHAEGKLSHLRAHMVEASACVRYVQKLAISEFLLLGKGERMNDGKGRETILSDLFEAIMGAVYLDGGIEACKKFFFSHFYAEVEEALREPLRNWKAELQDYSQKKHQKPPVYRVIKEAGPDHSKVFHVAVSIDNQEVGRGIGSSKKEAEQAAAAEAFSKLTI